jgi:pimeloyl-ACP methyl ester carboxylesterase
VGIRGARGRVRVATSPFLTMALCLGLAGAIGCKRDDASTAPPAEPSPTGLGATRPARIADVCADPSPRAWAILGNGNTTVAHTRGRCLGKEAMGWHVVSQVQDVGVAEPSYEVHLWLDDEGRPKRGEYRTASRVKRLTWIDGGLRTEEFGDVMRFEPTSPDTYPIPAHAVYLRELLIRLGIGVASREALQMGWSPERDAVIPLALTFVGTGKDARATSKLASFSTSGEQLAEVRLGIGTDGMGRTIYSPASDETALAFTEPLPAIPRLVYVLPEGLEVVPMRIEGKAGDPVLAGELVRAVGSTGKRPAIVFLSGSGPQDRHGFVPGTAIDVGSHELHDALARAGFAVLRFDDRGVGESTTGDDATPGYEAFVGDARRAIDAVMRHSDVDPRKVIVIGHSEGALTATLLADERFGKAKAPLAGVVLMAAPGRNLADIMRAQVRAVNTDPARLDGELADLEKIIAGVTGDAELPAAAEPMRRWMKEIFQYDPKLELAKAKVPVFLAQGQKDFQVDAKDDFAALEAILPRLPASKRCLARVYEGLDHVFKPEPGESKVGHYADPSRRVDTTFLADVVTWSKSQAGLP